MKFAINYSPQADELLREGAIDIDLFKCADWPELVEPAMKLKPAYVHFPLMAGKPNAAEPDWDAVQAWKEKTGTQYVNMHLSAEDEDFPAIPRASNLPEHLEQVTEQMIRDVKRVTAIFGPENVIVENVPMQLGKQESQPLRASVEPKVIRTVIEETRCGLLLDIDHARVASHEFGITYQDYIAELPVDRIRELHMTGTHMVDGFLQAHLPMKEDDWEIFAWALQNIQSGAWSHPGIMAFEYGGIGKMFEWRSKKEVMAEQVPEFRRMIDNLL